MDLDIDVNLGANAQTNQTRRRQAGLEKTEAEPPSLGQRSQLMTKFARIIADTQMSDETQLLEHL